MPRLTTPSRRALVRQLIRYGSVSAISTTISLVILGILVGLVGVAAVWANVIATSIATVPSFELNRRWVWAQDVELANVAAYGALWIIQFVLCDRILFRAPPGEAIPVDQSVSARQTLGEQSASRV